MNVIYFFYGITYFIGAILFCLSPEIMRNMIIKMKDLELRSWGMFIEVTGIILGGITIFNLVVYYKIFFSVFKQSLTFLPLSVWIIWGIIGCIGIILLIVGIFLIFVPWIIKNKINKLSSLNIRVYGSIIPFITSILFLLICRESILQTFINIFRK